MKIRVDDFPLILLAAGASSRMGMAKGLLSVQGQYFLTWQLDRFQNAGGRRAIIVLGADLDKYRSAIPWLSEAVTETKSVANISHSLVVDVVENKSWSEGPFSSLKTAIEIYIQSSSVGYGAFVAPIDTPFTDAGVWQALINQMGTKKAIVKPVVQGRGGHPVLLSDRFLRSMLNVPSASPQARLDLQIRQLEQVQIGRAKRIDPNILLNLNDLTVFQEWLRTL